MNKWNRLKKLYKWQVKNSESNPEPTMWDKYDKKCFEHVLTEMKRIDDDFNYNMKVAARLNKKLTDTVINYLENEMPKNPKTSFRGHAENILIRIYQIQDELANKELSE